MRRYLTILALVSLMFLSCSRERPLKTRTLEYSSIQAAAPHSQDSITINVILEYPTSGFSKEFVKNAPGSISSSLLDSVSSNTLQGAVDEYVARALDGYRSSVSAMRQRADSREEKIGEGAFRWEEYLSGIFCGEKGSVISYLLHRYSFEGGAHGNNWEDGFVLSKKDGRKISEAEYFTDDYYEEMSKLLSSHLSQAVGETYETLFEKEIAPNGNFTVDSEGVKYYYNTYEIAAFSFGIVKVEVPWDEVEHLVRDEYKSETVE